MYSSNSTHGPTESATEDRLYQQTPNAPALDDNLMISKLPGHEFIREVSIHDDKVQIIEDPDFCGTETFNTLVVGYPPETGRRIATAIGECANALEHQYEGFSLEHLQSVVIAANYQDALNLCSESARPYDRNFLLHVSNSSGCCFPTDQGVVMVLDGEVVTGALSVGIEAKVWGIHIIRHELCHVADLGKCRKWLMQYARSPQSFHPMYGDCYSLWAEYFANRFAHFGGHQPDTDVLRLSQLLKYMHILPLNSAISDLCAAMGFALGTLHAMNESLESVAPELHAQIASVGLLQAWNEADFVLRNMTHTWEAWKHQDGILCLTDIVTTIRQYCERFCRRD